MEPRRILAIFRICVLLALTAGALLVPKPGPASASGIAAVAAGNLHACALTTVGGLRCWGDNLSGQLGDGTTMDRPAPVDVSELTSGVIAVAAGGFHTCAVTTEGSVKCWGENRWGQLGAATTELCSDIRCSTTPVDVSGLSSGIVAVDVGWDHSCAVSAASGLKCWGSNLSGQLGDGTTTYRPTPVDVSALTGGVAGVAAGAAHTCALTTTGGVKCWGYNFSGELGDDLACGGVCLTPVDVWGLTSGAAALAVGAYHTCALTTGGGVKCWGANAIGQLGDGTTTDRTTPVDVSGLTSGAAAIAVGDTHTCALTTAGGVKCWGFNDMGQLGDGTTTDRTTPVDVSGLTSGIAAVAAGHGYTCALTTVSDVKCWGAGTDSLTPVDIPDAKPETVGDVNCDGSVSSIDAALVLQYGAALLASLPCQDAADVNENGAVNAVDATLILQYVAGIIHSLPV